MANLFESIMLLCFAYSLAYLLYKSWTSRQTVGKSLLFLLLIEFGYVVVADRKVN
jgi:glycopeptide antibiotics resistance protein